VTYNMFFSIVQSGSFVIMLICYLPSQYFRGREPLCCIAEGSDRGYEE